MAVNSQSLKFGKRFLSQIRSPLSSHRARQVHDSVYAKNHEEHVTDHSHARVVPDDLIPPQTEEYWAPHPHTGVFGPAVDQNTAPAGYSPELGPRANKNSVLDQKAFFRHHEDLDKPVVQP